MVQLKISKFQLKEFGMLLFEEWFGGNIDNKVFESAITFWFKDVDFDGDKVWEYFHMNN